MSRLQEELRRRATPRGRTATEAEILKTYDARVAKFRTLFRNKDFAEYLKLEAEMNDPKIVIALKCADPVCESLKQKIRDFWNRQRVLAKLQEPS
jgi:hypothetical protein